MPIVNPVITKTPKVIDALDIIDVATIELVLSEYDITSIYPIIVKSVDIT